MYTFSGRPYYYSGKSSGEKHTKTDRFIYLNDFGYCADHSNLSICRKKGRPDYQLIYVAYGTLTIHDEGRKLHLKSGYICLFRPNEPQIYTINGEKTTHYWILFTGSEVEKMLSFFKERSYHIGAFPEFEHFCHSLWSGSQADEEMTELSLDGTLITIIAQIMKLISQEEKKSKELSRLYEIIQIMKSECHIRRSSEELSKLCGLSKFYFIRLFKKTFGVSPQEYYANLIIEKSSHLLINTDYNISEIANLCGIEDALYFSRMFKKHIGISPNAYRKSKL